MNLSLRTQLIILFWLFSIGFGIIGGYILIQRADSNGSFISKFDFYNNGLIARKNVPILNDNSDIVVNVGRMVFIEGENITEDAVVMIDDKMVPKNHFTVVNNTGVYLKAKQQGVYRLKVINQFGPSKDVKFTVSNSMNITYSGNSWFTQKYSRMFFEINNQRVPLNQSGQGMINPMFIKQGVAKVTGVSNKTGVNEVLAIARLPKSDTRSGVAINTETTARYLIDNRLNEVGSKPLPRNPTERQVRVISELQEVIENEKLKDKPFDLQNQLIKNAVTEAVRKLRMMRQPKR